MYLYRASGHAKVIKEIIESNEEKVIGFIDDNSNIKELCNLPVLHNSQNLSPIIISIGDNKARKSIADKLDSCFAKAIHPHAVISKSATIESGTVVMAGAIINAEAKIGKHVIINTGASVDHECVIEDYAHISPHSTLCGNVHIGEGTWICAGATVIQGVKIGKWCVVAAGSIVKKDIPDGTIVAGSPAKILKRKPL